MFVLMIGFLFIGLQKKQIIACIVTMKFDTIFIVFLETNRYVTEETIEDERRFV